MKRQLFVLVFLTGLFCLLPLEAAAQQEVDGVIGSGGTQESNGTVRITSTVGQGLVGSSVGAQTVLSGFYRPPSGDATSTDRNNPDTPRTFALHGNYPNPFSGSTQIRYELPRLAEVTISVFDVLGRRVAVLVDGQIDAGTHTTEWNARTTDGGAISSGIYFYRMEAASFTRTKRMVHVR